MTTRVPSAYCVWYLVFTACQRGGGKQKTAFWLYWGHNGQLIYSLHRHLKQDILLDACLPDGSLLSSIIPLPSSTLPFAPLCCPFHPTWPLPPYHAYPVLILLYPSYIVIWLISSVFLIFYYHPPNNLFAYKKVCRYPFVGNFLVIVVASTQCVFMHHRSLALLYGYAYQKSRCPKKTRDNLLATCLSKGFFLSSTSSHYLSTLPPPSHPIPPYPFPSSPTFSLPLPSSSLPILRIDKHDYQTWTCSDVFGQRKINWLMFTSFNKHKIPSSSKQLGWGGGEVPRQLLLSV